MDQTTALELARRLMDQHGLTQWLLQLDRSKRRNGYCVGSTKTISLSKYYVELNDESKVRNTILHEIAHALVGVDQGHNDIWRAKAILIGSSGERCTSGVNRAARKWLGTCPNCNKEFLRYRRMTCACPCQNHLAWTMKAKIVWTLNSVAEMLPRNATL